MKDVVGSGKVGRLSVGSGEERDKDSLIGFSFFLTLLIIFSFVVLLVTTQQKEIENVNGQIEDIRYPDGNTQIIFKSGKSILIKVKCPDFNIGENVTIFYSQNSWDNPYDLEGWILDNS